MRFTTKARLSDLGLVQELNEVFLPQIRTPAPARTAQDRAAVMKKLQVIYRGWCEPARKLPAA